MMAAVVLLAGCTGSKSYSKRATKLDQAGLYAEAADMYLEAAQRNPKNVDAKIGLKTTGQRLLDDKLSAFFKAMAMGANKGEAVSVYLEAVAYQERVRRMGVVIEVPDHYRADFERVKGEHLVELYDEGQALLEKQDFRAAEAVFTRIAKLEPGYKDANSLRTLAYMEPLYRAGKADLEAGRYRKAHDELARVTAKDPGYKDAATLLQECLAKGRYSIAVLPFTSANNRNDVAAKAQAHAMTELTRSSDPFLKVVDRENMDRILAEQRMGLSGVVDEQTAVRVGNLMGAQAVLMGTVIDYREEPGPLQRFTRDGFESHRVQQVNKETGEKYFETRYRPVKYVEHRKENKVFLSFSYRLVSLETGEVLMSQVVDRQAADRTAYVTYDGNRDALFPANRGVVDPSDRARRELRAMMAAPRDVKDVATLVNEAIASAASAMASAIQTDLQSKLP